MTKNIRMIVLLMVAAVAIFAVSCNKPEPEPEPEIMNVVGTTWKQYYNKLIENTDTELDGSEITMVDEFHVLSADSLHRTSSMSVNGELVGGSDFNTSYTWDGSTLTFMTPSKIDTFHLHYRESDDVFYRSLDLNDPQVAYLAVILGINELVFYRQ